MAESRAVADILSAQFDLSGEVAVVTGGGGGIGRAIALVFASLGADVVILEKNIEAAEETVREGAASPGRLSARGIDLTDDARVARVFDEIAAQHGRIDILVNNAAVKLAGKSLEIGVDRWNQAIAANLSGVFFCARAAAKHMIARGEGRIVNIASIGGLLAGAWNRGNPDPAYRASKGGVVNLTRALAVEWGGSGVRVNGVAPGYVRTPMTKRLHEDPALLEATEARVPLGRIAEPEEIAWPVVFLAAHPRWSPATS